VPDELVDKKITQDEADNMMAPLELDLTALFKVIEQDMIDLIDNFEGTPEQYIKEVLSWLEPRYTEVNKDVKKDLFDKARKVLDTLKRKYHG